MSVAIRTATRLQDQDDVNVTLGVGVDEYALTWDNDTAKFVLRAVAGGGVTDHGLLTGLSDDDHSQYLLATGARTGASSQAQVFTSGLEVASGNIRIAPTASPTVGVLTNGVYPLLHTYHDATAVDQNFFAGGAGNFTMGPAGGGSYLGSYNLAFGRDALAANTLGYQNVAIGFSALKANTEGAGNVAAGSYALQSNTIGTSNFALGVSALSANTSGSQNVAIGGEALKTNTTGENSVALGYKTLYSYLNGSGGNIAVGGYDLYNLTTGEYNTAIGYYTGLGITTGNANTIIGSNVTGLATGLSNTVIIADGDGNKRLYIDSSGFAGIGTAAPATLLHGLLTSAATNAVTNVLTIGHDTSGTAAAGFGAGQLFTLKSSTTAAQNAARIQAITYEATHATRKYDLVGTAFDAGGEREGWRVRGNGSGPSLGFFGTAPAARPTGVAVTAAGIHAALVTLGLITA